MKKIDARKKKSRVSDFRVLRQRGKRGIKREGEKRTVYRKSGAGTGEKGKGQA